MSLAPVSRSTRSVAAPKKSPPANQLPRHWKLADVRRHLGVPLHRVRLFPTPGTATADDVLAVQDRDGVLCELEDGILVEKPTGWQESTLALWIGVQICRYLEEHDLGRVFGADGAVKLLGDKIKIPDVSFVSWSRFPRKKLPRRNIPALVPDLAVEVLSDSNTKAEMRKKLATYFQAGVRLVWLIDPATKTARVHRSESDCDELGNKDSLDGGDVLPGLQISLRELFARGEQQEPLKP